MDFHSPLDVVGSIVLSLSSPTQNMGTAGGCCFRVVNHYKMLVMFCLSRGKKNKIQKEKVWVGVKAALDMMQRGILSVLIKISNV